MKENRYHKPGRRPYGKLLAEVAVRVKEFRLEAGLTQKEFYELTGIHIARIETGRCNVSLSSLIRICQYCNKPVRELFVRERELEYASD